MPEDNGKPQHPRTRRGDGHSGPRPKLRSPARNGHLRHPKGPHEAARPFHNEQLQGAGPSVRRMLQVHVLPQQIRRIRHPLVPRIPTQTQTLILPCLYSHLLLSIKISYLPYFTYPPNATLVVQLHPAVAEAASGDRSQIAAVVEGY